MLAAITAYMAARKRIQGHDSAPTWASGFSPHEVVMKYPLEVGGELTGQLWVIGFPRSTDLKFRLQIVLDGPICRLDYTDETHPNSIDAIPTGGFRWRWLDPIIIHGPLTNVSFEAQPNPQSFTMLCHS